MYLQECSAPKMKVNAYENGIRNTQKRQGKRGEGKRERSERRGEKLE